MGKIRCEEVNINHILNHQTNKKLLLGSAPTGLGLSWFSIYAVDSVWMDNAREKILYPIHRTGITCLDGWGENNWFRGNCTSNQNWACFFMLSQNHQHFLKSNVSTEHPSSKLSEKLQNSIKILVYQAVLELLIKMCKTLFKTVWPTKSLVSSWSFSDNLLYVAYITFPKSVGNFEIAHKTGSILVGCRL